MPATWNGILSISRSEAGLEPARPCLAGRASPASARTRDAAPARRGAAATDPDLSPADEPPCGARLGRRAGRLGRGAAGRNRCRPSRSLQAHSSRSKGAQFGCTGMRTCRERHALTASVLSCGGPEAALCPADRTFLRSLARGQAERCDGRRRRAVPASPSARSASATPQAAGAAARQAARSATTGGSILAPPHLLRWLVAHEVAHRRHMDHGPDFRALEAELYGGDVAAARAELRALGPRLKRVGRAASDGWRWRRFRRRNWLRLAAVAAGLRAIFGIAAQHLVQPLLVDLFGDPAAAPAGPPAGCRIGLPSASTSGSESTIVACPMPLRRVPAASRASAPGSRTARPAAWRRRPS